MLFLYGITVVLLIVSFFANREKTIRALKMAVKKFLRLVPPFLLITIFVAISLYLIPRDTIAKVLGEDNLFLGVFSSSVLGSIALIPGFIVFPLCGLLKDQGVSYTVLSAFTTTLMMVGIITFPVEREYMGMKLTVARNISGFVMAIVVAVITGIVFGEIQL